MGPLWRNLRRISAVDILSATRLNSSSGIRFEEVRSMIKRLVRDTAACSGGGDYVKVGLKDRMYEVAYNTAMKMIAGTRCYGEEAVDEVRRRSREVVDETMLVNGASSLGDFVPALRWVEKLRMERTLKRVQAKRDAFMQSFIDDHRNRDTKGDGEERQKTMIDVLLSLQQEDADYYTDEIIKGMGLTLLNAGTDTSAIAMEWAMSLLLNHPDALNELRAELDYYVGSDRLVDESDLPNLTYLQCVIKEALRLYPPTPIIPAHESTGECKVAGFNVATGGFGRRACPGEGLAMRVVGLTLAGLIQCFEWKADGQEVDMDVKVGVTMMKTEPLEALCRPRPFVRELGI